MRQLKPASIVAVKLPVCAAVSLGRTLSEILFYTDKSDFSWPNLPAVARWGVADLTVACLMEELASH